MHEWSKLKNAANLIWQTELRFTTWKHSWYEYLVQSRHPISYFSIIFSMKYWIHFIFLCICFSKYPESISMNSFITSLSNINFIQFSVWIHFLKLIISYFSCSISTAFDFTPKPPKFSFSSPSLWNSQARLPAIPLEAVRCKIYLWVYSWKCCAQKEINLQTYFAFCSFKNGFMKTISEIIG